MPAVPASSVAALTLHISREALVEARQAAAAVEQLLLAAGPGRVGRGVDVERQLLAGLTPGRTGLIGRAVVQRHGDLVIVGVDALFHNDGPSARFEAGPYRG